MTVRFYSSVASEKTLTGTITAGQTTMVVSNTIGLPGLFPYTLAVDYESITEELVNVTNAAGTTLTIERAIDGTSASSHTAGARVRHVTSARDFSDSRNHENSDDGIHGLSPGEEIVGTDKVQILTNKTVVDLQGTLLNPDINLTGTDVTTWTRTPAGADTVQFTNFVNGAEETASIFNNGLVKVRNTAALDASVTARRFQFTMSNGTTERFYVEASGQVTSVPRAGTAAVNGGFKVLDPGDDTTRKLIQCRNAADSLDKFVVLSGGGVAITPTDASTIPLYVKQTAAPAVDAFRIVDTADLPLVVVESDGELLANRTVSIDNISTPAESVLQVRGNAAQSADLTTWQNSAGTAIARVQADGSADFTADVTTTGIFTAAAGWSVSGEVAVVKAGNLTLSLGLLRTGASIVADPGGDLFGDPPLGTIAAAFRPHSAYAGQQMTWAGTTGNGTGSAILNPVSGDMNLTTFSTGGTIFNGIVLRLTLTYPLNFS